MTTSEIKGIGMDLNGLPSRCEYQRTAVVSRHSGHSKQMVGWATRPLCTRYLVVSFGLQPAKLSVGNEFQAPSFYWALGTLDDGQSEILGWWQANQTAPFEWSAISNDLTARGVKRIRKLSDSSGALDTQGGADETDFGGGEVGSRSMSAAQQRRVAAAHAQARRVQAALSKAVLKHGVFADAETAAALIDSELQRLDRVLFWSQPDVGERRSSQTRMPLLVAA